MAFLETPRLQDCPSFGLTGGPGFSTSIAELDSGVEYANRNWEQSRHQYVISFDARKPKVVNDLLGFFMAVGGMHSYFRLKDPFDNTEHGVGGYVATSASGVFSVIDLTHYQMYKRYTCGALVHNRKIQKPVAGKIVVTGGTSPTVDSTTGIVTSSTPPTSWVGPFDVPVRFNTDVMRAIMISKNQSTGYITGWQQIELIEVRLLLKSVSTALKAHLAQHWQTMATCVKIVREDEVEFNFTDHDITLTLAGWAAPYDRLHGIYLASQPLSAKAVSTSDAMNVDNTRGLGVFTDDSITEEDLYAGLFNNARVTIFQVNWSDLTMTPLVQRTGWIGNVQSGRIAFDAEFMGLMKLYGASLCELTSVACRAELGDGRCKVDLAPFTHTGTLTGVGADNATLYDTSRSEPGPGAGVAIIGITNANPGVVTMADDSLGLTNGQPVVISGAGGMVAVNAQTIARNPSGATFELGVDTSDTGDYPPYTSGGVVTPLGGAAGYFDFGKITFTSGLNAGRTFDIQAYVKGQFTLYMPLPKLAMAGDGYIAVAGCDKSKATCIGTYNNINNRRAEDFMAGTDRMVQVGRGG